MSISATEALLAADEPPCFGRRDGSSPFLIAVDHASRLIPRRLGDLGLDSDALERHIAWDIGAQAVAEIMARQLDATLLIQNYSRLVIDCNRDPSVPSSIPEIGETLAIPGNQNLDPLERTQRRREIFDPYHDQLRQILDLRQQAGQPTILVAQHSMTPIFKGERRLMDAAIMSNRDRRFADALLASLRREPDLIIADNEPYYVSDTTDYTLPVHGEARGILHVGIEIRQDLITTGDGQAVWAERIARALGDALQLCRACLFP